MFNSFKKQKRKPLIFPRYQIAYSKENFYALCIFLSKEDLEKLQNIRITEAQVSTQDLFLTINNYQLVFHDLKENIIHDILAKKLFYYFFDEDKQFIQGIKIT